LLIRNHHPLGPYRRPMPRVLGGWAFSYERGTPVNTQTTTLQKAESNKEEAPAASRAEAKSE